MVKKKITPCTHERTRFIGVLSKTCVLLCILIRRFGRRVRTTYTRVRYDARPPILFLPVIIENRRLST
jgi:hypothetical protein